MSNNNENTAAYKDMYFELFSGISNTIEQLQMLQELAEEAYVSKVCDESALTQLR